MSYYDGKAVPDINALAQRPMLIGPDGSPVHLSAHETVRRAVGPIAVERNQLQRAAHVYMQTEGRDIGSVSHDPIATYP